MPASPLNLADTLKRHIDGIRNRHYCPLGYLMRMQLGVCDDSAYFQDPVNRHVGSISRVQGLTLDWSQDCYPQIAELQDGKAGRTEIFVFPRGVVKPPKMADPRYRRLSASDPFVPQIPQDVDHYASGRIFSREYNDWLRVLQPVEQLAIRVTSTFVMLNGRTNPWNGTKVAFLYSPKKEIGFLVGGLLTFD